MGAGQLFAGTGRNGNMKLVPCNTLTRMLCAIVTCYFHLSDTVSVDSTL